MCTLNLPLPKGYSDDAIEDIKKKVDCIEDGSDIVINGGEPTIKKEFFQLMSYIKNTHPISKIKLITNGRLLFYDEFVQKLSRIKGLYIITELHGSNENTHDDITRAKGSFSQTKKGIRNVLDKGIDLELRIVVSKKNYQDIPDIVRLYEKEFPEVKKIVIFPIDYIGNAHKNIKECSEKISAMIPYIEKAINISSEKIKIFHVPYCIMNKRYWNNIKGDTVVESRLDLGEECLNCIFDKRCPKPWKTYVKRHGNSEFKSIKREDYEEN